MRWHIQLSLAVSHAGTLLWHNGCILWARLCPLSSAELVAHMIVEKGCEAIRTQICRAIAAAARHHNWICQHNAIVIEAALQVAKNKLPACMRALGMVSASKMCISTSSLQPCNLRHLKLCCVQ